jgi:ankyrin repeat protein
MSETKYLNFEMIIMDTKILKEELKKELKSEQPDETYIEEILTYGAWGDLKRVKEKDSTLTKAFKLLHKNDMNLNFLAKQGYASLIKKNPKINPNLQDWDGYTALMDASRWGSLQVVKAILEHPKTNLNLQSWNGYTALHWASSWGRSQVVQELLKHPKINLSVKDRWGNTALMTASRGGRLQVVEELLKHPNINIRLKNNDGKTAWDRASKKISQKFPELNPNANKFFKENLLLKSLLKEISTELPENSKNLQKIKDLLS